MVKGAPLQVDLSGNFMFNEKFVQLLIGVSRAVTYCLTHAGMILKLPD
jgi:hypothetical protein